MKDTLLVISAYLDMNSSGAGFTDEEARLLADDVAVFEEKIGLIAGAVATRLIELERRMAEIAALANWDNRNSIDIHNDNEDTARITDRGMEGDMDNTNNRNNMHTGTDAGNRSRHGHGHGGELPAKQRQPPSSSPWIPPTTPADHVPSASAQPPSKQVLVSNLTTHSSTEQTLVSLLTLQRAHLASLRDTLPTTLTTLSSSLTTLLTLHRDIVCHRLRTLQATKHGVLSRWTSSRASFLSSVATAMSLKTRILVLQEQNNVGHSRSSQVITDKMNSLDEQDTILDRRIEELSSLLGQYSLALHDDPRRGFEVLKTLGRRYGEIENDIERVREDIERLKMR